MFGRGWKYLSVKMYACLQAHDHGQYELRAAKHGTDRSQAGAKRSNIVVQHLLVQQC